MCSLFMMTPAHLNYSQAFLQSSFRLRYLTLSATLFSLIFYFSVNGLITSQHSQNLGTFSDTLLTSSPTHQQVLQQLDMQGLLDHFKQSIFYSDNNKCTLIKKKGNMSKKESQDPKEPLLTFQSISFQIRFYSFFVDQKEIISHNQLVSHFLHLRFCKKKVSNFLF